jgi:hypothetical protein
MIYLVRLMDSKWNQLIPSLYLLHRKLEKLGFITTNNEVVYLAHDILVK